jgi:taurine dioxygenase
MEALRENGPPASIDVTPGPNGFGAEVAGIDLSGPLSDGEIAAVEQALVAHKVLFFRDQHIDSEQQLAFGRRFGPLEVHPFAGFPGFNNGDENPELIALESTPEKPQVAEVWHSDVTWREAPSLGSILRMTHCPEAGGDTLWADMTAAYEGLDDATQSFLSGLVAVHDWGNFRNHLIKLGAPDEQIAALDAKFPAVEHPVVRTHPVSGRKLIYVNAEFTRRIKGMDDAESDALLKRLFALADNPDYRARMHWHPGSVAFWDNRSTQHRVMADVRGYRRVERVTVMGDRPF